MNFSSLKSHHLIAHWIPGFLAVSLITAITVFYLHESIAPLFATGPAFLLVVAGVLMGQIIDAARGVCLEGCSWWAGDEENDINWDFFFTADAKSLQNLDEYFFIYYEFSANCLIAIAMIVLAALSMAGLALCSGDIGHLSAQLLGGQQRILVMIPATAFILAAIWVLYRDARMLREEIARHTNTQPSATSAPPHAGVFTRLCPSSITPQGVGVFALVDIPQGTKVFGDDTEPPLVPVEPATLAQLTPPIRKLYEDFCIIHEGKRKYEAPTNFNHMTVSWYLNHSETPNVSANEDAVFISARDIRAGEELTVDYATYNQWDVLPDYMRKEHNEQSTPC